MGLSFTNAAGSRQHSHSKARVPRDSWPHFTASDSRHPQPGEPGPRIYEYIPQELGSPVIPPVTGFPFRRLRLSGLRCRYSNLTATARLQLTSSIRRSDRQKSRLSTVSLLFHADLMLWKRVYRTVAYQWPPLLVLLFGLSAVVGIGRNCGGYLRGSLSDVDNACSTFLRSLRSIS
jgi:hypothetical protein